VLLEKAMLMTKNLPLPQRYAGGYLYSDRQYGVLHTPEGEETALPMEVITSKGPQDHASREEALAMLALAPVGSLYEVTRECRPEEEETEWVTTYRKTGKNEWTLIA
jgi:hypothetical protein